MMIHTDKFMRIHFFVFRSICWWWFLSAFANIYPIQQ